MAKMVIGLVACLLLALSGCTSAESMSMQVRFTGVAYDTIKDPNNPAVYRSRSAFDDEHESQSEQIKAQTLLNGVQTLQKAGYDHFAWRGPLPATLVKTTKTASGTTVETKVYRGFDFVVQGWKSTDGNIPAGVRPISVALAELRGQAAQVQPAGVATAAPRATASSSRFEWPLKGEIMAEYGTPRNGKQYKMIVIGAPEGTIVRAAAGGVADIVGPAALTIIHAGDYRTAYACVDSVLLKQGAIATVGQPIAKVGKGGTCKDVADSGLKFGVLRKSEQLDPLSVLPAQ